MKKGIVMELHRKYTIIMTEEGSFQKTIPVRDAEIGTEVVYEPLKANKGSLFFFYPSQKLNVPIRLLAMACIVLLFISPFYFLAGNEETYAYINIEINPSIELEIDEGLHVQAIEPLNKDATSIVEGLTDYQNKNIETVIEMIMNKSEASGLIKNGKNMLVGVSYVAEDKAKNATIINHLKGYFKHENPNWKIAAFKVPKDIREKAQNSNKSMNEVMATTIIETDNDTAGNINNNINDNDKAIINSFYNENKNKPENSDENTDNNKSNKTSLKIKEKQSDNHKRDKNGWNSSTPDQRKDKDKDKDKAKNNVRKSNKKDKKNKQNINRNKHAHNNDKSKEHKHKHKHKQNQDNGNHYGQNKEKSKKAHRENDKERYEKKDKEHSNRNKRSNKGKHNNHKQKKHSNNGNHKQDKHNKKGKHP